MTLQRIILKIVEFLMALQSYEFFHRFFQRCDYEKFIAIEKTNVGHLFKFDFRNAVIPIFGNSYGDQSAVFVGSGLAVGSKSCLAAISIKIPFEKRVTPLLLLRAVGTEGQGG